MILDLHVHSTFSGDSPVEPEEYAKRLVELQDEYEIDGLVLMEHNYLITKKKCDVAALSEKYGILVLAGVEADTYWGHLLCYGIDRDFWKELEKGEARKQDPVDFSKRASELGAALAPSHPFRGFIGIGDRTRELHGICAVEGINGSDSDLENLGAQRLAKKLGLPAIGGSDGHFLAELGKGLTKFEREITSMDDLVAELKAGRCQAMKLEDAGK